MAEDVKIRRFGSRMREEIRKSLTTEMAVFVKYIRETYLTGGTKETKLAVRSGKLRASLRSVPPAIKNTSVETGITVGTIYGPTHFGPLGQITTIRPKVKQWLTIPLDAAKTKAGVARGAAKSGIWGETFFRREVDDEGKPILILYGKKVSQRGRYAGQTRGGIVPLFRLVKEVKIPARVDPRELARWIEPKLTEAFREATRRSTEG